MTNDVWIPRETGVRYRHYDNGHHDIQVADDGSTLYFRFGERRPLNGDDRWREIAQYGVDENPATAILSDAMMLGTPSVTRVSPDEAGCRMPDGSAQAGGYYIHDDRAGRIEHDGMTILVVHDGCRIWTQIVGATGDDEGWLLWASHKQCNMPGIADDVFGALFGDQPPCLIPSNPVPNLAAPVFPASAPSPTPRTTVSEQSDLQIIFVIDTDSYAGNFEREMCAYVTGQIGECGVGDGQAEDFNAWLKSKGIAENPFEDILGQVADDNGCHRPCAIWETPGRWNNGSGSHYNDAEFSEDKSWMGLKHPAYESVAIFFNERPSDDLIAMMKERAAVFAANHLPYGGKTAPIAIRGFRLLEKKTVTTVVETVSAV